MADHVGYAWLRQQYGIDLCQPLSMVSSIGPSRKTVAVDGVVSEIYQNHYRPTDTLTGHLTFALKREPLSLEFLSRLFSVLDAGELAEWIRAEPTGQYARRACYLYEWLTGAMIDHPGISQGNYVNILDENEYLVATQPTKDTRWRVNDNLPGNRYFCPVVRKTETIKSIEQYDIASAIEKLGVEFGQEILLKSVVWLTIKESKSSFAIEHEQKKADRIRRFAHVMEEQCGKFEDPLSSQALNNLQKEILGENSLSYGIRQSPVIVGETRGYNNIIHYLAPHWDDVPNMLLGLEAFEFKTRGQNAILRAAAISFGFVYIHPMSDGNGRISRFFINDSLRRDKALPEPYILPVSAVMQDKSFRPRNYDQTLEAFSKPLMGAIREHIDSDSKRTEYGADGIPYDIHFSKYHETNSAWRYIDLTQHCEYLGRVIQQTIEQEMRSGSQHHDFSCQSQAQIKETLEAPDHVIDRIIRSVRQSNGAISNKLKGEHPLFERQEIADQVVEAVKTHLPWDKVISSDGDFSG